MHRWNGSFLLYILPSGGSQKLRAPRVVTKGMHASQKVCTVGMAPSSAVNYTFEWHTKGLHL